VRASRELDGKTIFEFVSRGKTKRIAVNSEHGLGGTDLSVEDAAVEVCPVGAILLKRRGFDVPVGRRRFDHEPIGVPPAGDGEVACP
jgi:[NiFe] hydrogenase diaphorase moiety small subunit